MKFILQTLFVLLLAVPLRAQAQNNDIPFTEEVFPQNAKPAAAKVDFAPELAAVTAQLKEKFDAGKTNATDLAENLEAIKNLIVLHMKDGNREQLARLYLLDAHIYADGLNDTSKAQAIWGQVVRDFPGTMAAKGASLSIARLNAQRASEPDANVPEGLEVGQKFPGFNLTDLAGNPLFVAAYKGRVTLIDFWATWCGPCRAEMPNVIATYNRYHAQGFDIIGISLDSNQSAVLNFTKAQGMMWAQYFDGLAWDNKLAKKYNVQSIPMAYLLDGHGVIIAKELRGAKLASAVAKALASR